MKYLLTLSLSLLLASPASGALTPRHDSALTMRLFSRPDSGPDSVLIPVDCEDGLRTEEPEFSPVDPYEPPTDDDSEIA